MNDCPTGEKAGPTETYPSDCEILHGYRTRSHASAEDKECPEWQLLLARAEPLKLLLLDVDGVLTDGTLHYSEDGRESKSFHTQDGLGIRLVQKAGVEIGLITARTSELVQRRADELQIKHLCQGVSNKLDAYKKIIGGTGLKPFQIGYMGDDWIDLPLLTRVGLAACPANGVPEVKKRCHYITEKTGGKGAVREFCNLLLHAKGVHDKLLQEYMS